MRVLHINRNYMSTVLHQHLIDHLNQCGVENYVFAPICKADEIVTQPKDFVSVSKCFSKWHRFFYHLKQKKILSALKNLMDVSSFDCIHAYTLFTDGNVAMKLSEEFHKPFVVAVRDTDVNCFFKKLVHLRSLGVQIMQKASKIIFLSPAYRKEVLEKYIPKECREELLNKMIVIPNGIDDFWHDNLNFNERKIDKTIRLIFAGRIDKRKNILSILKAMDVLSSKGIDSSLSVVGKKYDHNVYEILVNNPKVRVVPAMPKEQLIEEYRNHDIFVMPSFTETFGLVYAEAISQGLPVVYSKGQGFDGQFEEGLVGYHCVSSNVNDVANAIEKVVTEYSNIQENCCIAVSKFKWDDICRNYIEVYKSL